MTLRTITFDDSTHKLVPLEPDHVMVSAALCGRMMPQSCDVIARIRQQMKSDLAAAIAAAPEYQEPENLLDTPLPCDIKVGHGTIGKGCKLSTLVLRMNTLYDLAMKNQDIKKDE